LIKLTEEIKINTYHACGYEEAVGVGQPTAQTENTTKIEQAQIDGGSRRYGMPYAD
jgi:hypothetical protein